MRKVAAAVAFGVLTFALGALFFGVVGAAWYRQAFGHISRPRGEMVIAFILLEKLLQGALITSVYLHFTPVPRRLQAGLRLGLLMTPLLVLPWIISMWVNYPLALTDVVIVGMVDSIRIFLGCILIALIVP